MKKIMSTVASMFAVGLLAGCGGHDNVAACEEWVKSVSCGNVDVSTMVQCKTYENTTCDISPYFDCLSTNTKCSNGQLDSSGWMQCASKATCN